MSASLRTLLLVDEVRWFRELGEHFLARSGRVLSCGNATEALRIARRERPAAIVTALELRGRDGAALCRDVRRDPCLATTPVVIVIGSREAAAHARAIRAGASDVLSPPLSRVALVDAIRRQTRFVRLEGRPRVALTAPVEVEPGGATGWLRNVSRGGAFLETSAPLPHGCDWLLRFRLPGAAAPLQLTARVVWTRVGPRQVPAGQGVRFVAVDRAGLEALDAFLAARALQPAEPAVGAER